MSAVTGIYLFRLLLNIVFLCPEIYFYLNKQCIPDDMPHDGISSVYKSKKHVPKNIFYN